MAFRRRRAARDEHRILRKDRRGADPVKVGLVVLVACALIVYFGFSKSWPLSHPFRFQAVFPSANSIRLASPVRIAGVNVGKVVAIDGQEGTGNAVVTMEIQDAGLPIHKDARLKIRPRIFLEGNFFVDLHPGTPEAATISDGDRIPVGQTATPVQLDEVLTALQRDTRKDLQVLLVELGDSLERPPTAAQDAAQPAFNRGLSAAESLNRSLAHGEDALRGTAIVNKALQGVERSDLTALVRGLAKTGTALESRERDLGELVDNLGTTVAAIASQQAAVRSSVRELGPTVRNAHASLGSLNASLPNVRAFALELIPGVRQTQPTIDALTPWIEQARALVSKGELGGIVDDLRPTTKSLAATTAAGTPLLREGDLLGRCFRDVLLPVGDVKLDDGPFSTGKENYKELWYAMVGLAGEAQGFDGNGQFLRFQTGGGQYKVKLTGGNVDLGQPLFGNSVGRPLGTKPAWPGVDAKPAFKPAAPCYKQPLPDFAGTPTGPSDAGG